MARILIAEDDPFIRDFLTRALRRAGHTVQLAANGLIAHEHLLSDPYDLLIMHLNIPGYSGADLMHEAKALREAVPVVIHTGHIVLPEVAARADVILRKPFRLHDLLASINGALTSTS